MNCRTLYRLFFTQKKFSKIYLRKNLNLDITYTRKMLIEINIIVFSLDDFYNS